jgi:bifunctional DNase/RNase
VKVVIDRLVNRTYFASLVIESDGQLIEVDCRPSDAIALALREQASMFVDEELMYRIKFVELSEGEEDDGDDDEGITEALEQVDAQTFQQFLKGISPSDFKDG